MWSSYYPFFPPPIPFYFTLRKAFRSCSTTSLSTPTFSPFRFFISHIRYSINNIHSVNCCSLLWYCSKGCFIGNNYLTEIPILKKLPMPVIFPVNWDGAPGKQTSHDPCNWNESLAEEQMRTMMWCKVPGASILAFLDILLFYHIPFS